METHHISPERLTIDRIHEIISQNMKLALSDESRVRIQKCREFLNRKAYEPDKPIYGVTTGFGSLCNITISEDQLAQLQKNLVMSHACSIGDRLPSEVVKIMMLTKIHALSLGFSGVQVETVQLLIDLFNNDIVPLVFKLGSLGASGDLAPLANMCLPLLGLGEVEYRNEVMPASQALELASLKPIVLRSKEGLALLNGTQNMQAQAIWAIIQSKRLVTLADKIGALSLDAFDGRIEPFYPQIQQVRPHRGQIETGEAFIKLLEGSEILSQPKKHVQDPYSFRCIPQVHGAVKDALRYVESVIEIEINSATDNPTVFPDEDLIISAGNFHGEPIAIPMDYLCIAMSELGNISERRTYQLVDGKRELPSFLVAMPGVNSGFMIPQYAAAAIVNKNKALCWPTSCDSIPSSQNQEDIVSMGANSATKLCEVVENTERILAIELFNAAQALEFRRPLKSSPIIERMVADYRNYVPFIERDTVMYPLINKSVEFLKRFELTL